MTFDEQIHGQVKSSSGGQISCQTLSTVDGEHIGVFSNGSSSEQIVNDRCNTLKENNPDVLTPYAHKLGAPSSFAFHDVFSIDDPELIALAPRPALALVLLYPLLPGHMRLHAEDNAHMSRYTGKGESEPVFWCKQTIVIDTLLSEATPLDPTARSQVLYDSDDLERLHVAASHHGQSHAPEEEAGDFIGAFITFVKGKDGHMWQLGTSMKGPVDRGLLQPDEDMLSEAALNAGPRRLLAADRDSSDSELRFSITVLADSA
ncbi:hypothetical protein MRB53_037336 [Persea americana]|nr:hypothetical protein MRB53_037336 [Persea americana]